MAETLNEKRERLGTEMQVARSKSIEAYSSLEQSLAKLLALCVPCDSETAGTIFFRISNTRSRMAIITALLKKRYGSGHSLFWNSAEKLIRVTDNARNNVIHWQTIVNIGHDVEVNLAPPNIWGHNDDTPSLSISDLDAFAERCHFISGTLNVFLLFLLGKLSPETHGSWHDTFRQPLDYPIPEAHPLFQKNKE